MTASSLQALHQRLLRDRGLQFDFSQAPPPPQLPKWLLEALQAVGKAVVWAWPGLKIFFWVALAAAVAAVLYLIFREAIEARWPSLKQRRRKIVGTSVDFTPDSAVARALLGDADALAADGRFDDAARLILRRSIQDIDERRPRVVRPALTAREISGLPELPALARETFARMAAIVETSLFAGRALAKDDFADCRAAYEAFAFPGAWR
ncbi:MAG TPA: hypothetical protein VG248_13055 [Caulobacteraceae bacterium]|jgi:hypothetical protein|nr:hypothetical protein [Caulobacteraceae bacterium]